jgi:cysteinyl-tRNA synthetase
MLRFTGEKMSKSVGNVESIAEVLDRWGPETTLLFFMTAHWRSPIDFSEETLRAAHAQAESFRNAFRGEETDEDTLGWEQLVEVLDDDFNTPEALAVFHHWRTIGRLDLLERGLDLFGLGGLAEEDEAPVEVHALAAGRQEARAAKDFARADELREEIEAAGWEVRDDPGGYRLVPRR